MKKIHLFYLTVKENEWNINLFIHICFVMLRYFVVGKFKKQILSEFSQFTPDLKKQK